MESKELVKLAANLYDLRDRAKSLLGDKYKAQMDVLGKILRMTAERDKKNIIQAAMDVVEKRDLTGIELMLVMAAAVELTEPSK